MEDIICTIPNACDNKDCPHDWHLAHYWIYDDGTYSVCDSDGNHEDCEECDVPDANTVDRLWKDYSRYVLATGTDPLGEFLIKREIQKKERWTFEFGQNSNGMYLRYAGRRGRWKAPRFLPEHVLMYAQVRDDNAGLAYVYWSAGDVELTRNGRITATIKHAIPRNPDDIARELRTRARKHLAGVYG